MSTHVLDTALGRPAQGIRISLSRGASEIGSAITDADGRANDLQGKASLAEGDYRLTFQVGTYFSAANRESFYSVVAIDFRVEAGQHYHVPLLLSPFGYSTYRGS